jgi:hypothetical protein
VPWGNKYYWAHPLYIFQNISTLSPSMQEVATTIMEVDNEVASKQCSQAIKEVP